MPAVASQAGMWTLQSCATSVKTLSVPVPVIGQVTAHAIEAERNRVARAGNLALDAERTTQSDIQAIGEHHEPRRDHVAVGERRRLPVSAGLDVDDLVAGKFRRSSDFGTDRGDQRVIHGAELLVRGLVQQ